MNFKKFKKEEEKWFIGQSEYVDGRLIATFNDWLFFMMNSTTNEDWDPKRTKKVDLLLFLLGPSPEIFTIVRKQKRKKRKENAPFCCCSIFIFRGRWNAEHLVDFDIVWPEKNITA
jgi:hypothetical protein